MAAPGQLFKKRFVVTHSTCCPKPFTSIFI
jgi:hypothetical protein